MANWTGQNPDKVSGYRRKLKEKNPKGRILINIRKQAKRRGLDFNLDMSDIIIPEYCPVLGIKLSLYNERAARSNSVSVDRIDNSKGYIKGNVHIISVRANTLKNNATVEELVKIANYFQALDKQKNLC